MPGSHLGCTSGHGRSIPGQCLVKVEVIEVRLCLDLISDVHLGAESQALLDFVEEGAHATLKRCERGAAQLYLLLQYLRVYVYVCVYAHMSVYVRIRMQYSCICKYVHTRTHTRAHTHTLYTYTNTCTQILASRPWE